MINPKIKTVLKILLKFLLVLVLLYAAGRFVVVYQDSKLTGTRAPYIQMLGTNSVVIHWLSDNDESSIVRYGEDKDNLTKIVIDEAAVKNHIVKLSGLKPATRYYYQTGKTVASPDFNTEKQWFYTHPDNVRPTRVWVIGDSGQAGETLDQVRDSALNWMQQNPEPGSNPLNQPVTGAVPLIDVWIALGDIAYRSGTNEQYQAALFDTFADLTSNTVLWPVYGNHDDRRWTYFRIFDLPENAESGGLASNTENYYAVDYSNIHFVMLDSQESDRSTDGKMANWLKNDLAQNTRPWVIVVFHHPPYTKGSHDSDDASDSRGRMQDMRENILPILEKSGVDLLLSGHSHMYERSYLIDCAYDDSTKFTAKNIVSDGINGKHQDYVKPLQQTGKPIGNQGTIYVVAGSSSKVDQGPLDHPVHKVGLLEAGSMVIDISDDKLIARFINNKGEVRDTFSITKQDDYESGYQGCE